MRKTEEARRNRRLHQPADGERPRVKMQRHQDYNSQVALRRLAPAPWRLLGRRR